MNWFDRANNWINQAENSMVNFFSAIAPWLAPLVPMQITIEHMTGYLGFNWFVAISAGLVVEILGLASVSTILRLWRHNQTMKANKDKQPMWIVVFVYLFYLAVILAVIALPELSKAEQDWIAVSVKILLALLSVPAGITLAIRSQNTEILQEVEAKKAGKLPRQVADKLPKVSGKKDISDWRNLPHEDRRLVAEMTTPQIMNAYSIPERTARNWKSKASSNGKV